MLSVIALKADLYLLTAGNEMASTLLTFCKPIANGPEFVSKDLDLWAYMNGVTLDFSRPGKPTDNAFIESFNGKVRSECLNTSWFLSLEEAQSKCEAWREDYNEVRPHSAIGNKAPIELVRAHV